MTLIVLISCALLWPTVRALPEPAAVHPLIPRINSTTLSPPRRPPQFVVEGTGNGALAKRDSDEWQAPPGATFLNLNNAQWDQDNPDHAQQIRVRQAWDMANSLAHEAVTALTQLQDTLDSEASLMHTRPNSNRRINDLRMVIAALDPAYTQMFSAHPLGILQIRDNFVILEKAGDSDLQFNQRNGRQLFFTKVEAPRQINPPDPNICSGTTQAFAVAADNFGPVVDMWANGAAGPGIPGQNDWIVNFCPSFFKMLEMGAQLDLLTKDPNGNRAKICNLANLDTTARVLLHEVTHLPWMLNTNVLGSSQALSNDYIGFSQAASHAVGKNKDTQPPFFNSFSSHNAESYTWYGVYNFMNQLDLCSGVRWQDTQLYTTGFACTDVWPPGTKKWTKNTWTRWQWSNT